MVRFGQKLFYSGKSGYIREKLVVFLEKRLNLVKVGCNRAKVVVFGQSGCIRKKKVVFGQK